MNERENNFSSILFAFLIGGLVGAGVALLMAPKSGEETRNLLRDKSMEMKDRAVNTAEETRERAGKAIGDLANQTKERVTTLANRGQETVEEQKARLDERMDAAMRST